jgi:hypothetical protein
MRPFNHYPDILQAAGKAGSDKPMTRFRASEKGENNLPVFGRSSSIDNGNRPINMRFAVAGVVQW